MKHVRFIVQCITSIHFIIRSVRAHILSKLALATCALREAWTLGVLECDGKVLHRLLGERTQLHYSIEQPGLICTSLSRASSRRHFPWLRVSDSRSSQSSKMPRTRSNSCNAANPLSQRPEELLSKFVDAVPVSSCFHVSLSCQLLQHYHPRSNLDP